MPAMLPPGTDISLTAQERFDGTGITGSGWSGGVHACIVEVDVATGAVEILRYVVVEDCGRLINPSIVDGQICGGVAQGIGTALYEEMRFDAEGQPTNATFADYLLPGSAEVPAVRIIHMETPSPYTRFGQKGLGEGGAIAPPAAITNAINDALKGLGAELLVSPVTPDRIVAAIRAANAKPR
jgi:carbon-monoxide dehydrogenase large subunit